MLTTMTSTDPIRPARLAATLALLSLATATVTGCSTGSTPTSPSASVLTSPTPSPTSSATTDSPRPSSSTTVVPIEGQCDTADLSGSIGPGGGGAAGSVEVTIVLTNNGTSPCSLQGWPGVSFVGDENGTQLGAAAEFDRTAPHPTVALAPGGTATAPLRITNALNYPESECQPQKPDGFRVYPPGSTASLFVKYDEATACTSDSVSLLTVKALVAG